MFKFITGTFQLAQLKAANIKLRLNADSEHLRLAEEKRARRRERNISNNKRHGNENTN